MNSYAIRTSFRVRQELAASAFAEARGEFFTAFHHLERAHVFGQAVTREHVLVHWHMLEFSLRNRLPGVAAGQLWRLVAVAVFTVAGLVPAENTGGTSISSFRRQPIAKELKQVLDTARN